jgi:tRNA dimethylallyltransferase
MDLPAVLRALPRDRPVLIAGPTASGKSALALALAEAQGGVVVNADALQVYDGWRILTARPSLLDEARVPHALYGHVAPDGAYSVGEWLADLRPLVGGRHRPIITGGTGLYLSALTTGLATIPPIPLQVRAAADSLPLAGLLAGIDTRTRSGIDIRNRARVQRAWEVATATGRSLAEWQDATPPPLLPLADVTAIVLAPDTGWLDTRIAARFDAMLAGGVLDEARAVLPRWDPSHLSARAIGATELIAHLRGRLTLPEARDATILATRQYAKRQRTWFRNRFRDWHRIALPPESPG